MPKPPQMQYQVVNMPSQPWVLWFSQEFLVLRLTKWGHIFVLVAN